MTLARLTLPLAATLVLAAGAARAEDATDAQVRKVEAHKIVLTHGDGATPRSGLFVSRIQTNGEEPVTSLQVLGSEAQAIEVDDLADGETRSFEVGDGKWMDVTREGDTLRIDIDGDEITVPLNGGPGLSFPGLSGADGVKEVKVMMLTDGELPEGAIGPHVMTFIGEDGTVQHPHPGEDFVWHGDGTALSGSRVIVKRIGEPGGDGEEVEVMALPALPLHGLVGHGPDLENLKALEGADPEVREKVIEALKEILGRHHALRLDVEVTGEGEGEGPNVVLRRVAPGTRTEIR